MVIADPRTGRGCADPAGLRLGARADERPGCSADHGRPRPRPKPAAAAATTAPAAAATTAPAAAATTAPAAAGAATKPAAAAPAGAATAAPAAGGAATATPAPSQSVVQAVAALQMPKLSAKPNGKLQILQNQDFHPDHNAFVRLLLEESGKAQGWQMDISYIAGFQSGSDLNTKLTAMVQAGTPPDVMDHNTDTRPQTFLGVLEPVTDLVDDLVKTFGKPNAASSSRISTSRRPVPWATASPGGRPVLRAGRWLVRAERLVQGGRPRSGQGARRHTTRPATRR